MYGPAYSLDKLLRYLGESHNLKLHDSFYGNREFGDSVLYRLCGSQLAMENKWWDWEILWSEEQNLVGRPKSQSPVEQTGACDPVLFTRQVVKRMRQCHRVNGSERSKGLALPS